MLLSAALLCLSCPAMLLAMLAVRITSPGPALYFQERLGLRGRRIMICKIRTMTLNCERESGAVWSTPGDPRVTPIGRFLRRVHLDELPQLVNVLRGDMSLVGPRPERPEIVAQIERALPHYRRRLEVRPGLTGLAQVLQPPDTDLGSVQRKLELDLQYMEQESWIMDVKILLATPLHMINYPSRSIARFLQVSLDDLDAPASLAVSDSASDGVHVQATYAS
ncbi:sugar transferase [Planctomyces sp. SH-PL62]|uniref:sugar transferase n=1 Tax=Planctomyces sp. SH-PL62 TaxID=1636152 RepID=UPI00083957AD